MSNRLLVLLLVACASLIGLIAFEFTSMNSDSPVVEATALQAASAPKPPLPGPNVADLVATTLAGPLFSPTRRPSEQAGAEAASDLADFRLSGIVIEPDRRIAIFAAGAKPFIRAEGESLNNWRLDNISPYAVSLSGPEGTRTLEPKADKNLVRPAPPTAAAGQRGPAGSARPGVAGQVSGVNRPPPMAKMPPPGMPTTTVQDNLPRSP
jgi:hypothetical protein